MEPDTDETVAQTADEIIESTRDFILKELSKNLKGYDLEPFVANLLQAMGYYALVNPETLDDVISETKGVVGQANISVTQSRNLVIPLPSVSEQIEIVRILDDLLAKERRAKEAAEDVLEQIDLIKKAILDRAFRGELGTNDPSEESAVELLKTCYCGKLQL